MILMLHRADVEGLGRNKRRAQLKKLKRKRRG